ncbi:glycosyl transferase [Blomia tropicalis]|nr:glycosyl transferase [Blomia tropicalis]
MSIRYKKKKSHHHDPSAEDHVVHDYATKKSANFFYPFFYSTDFEVHRNWMAIVSNLPISKWYSENTSQWTLDYPPFFAYFELCLSYFAPYFDLKMLHISKDGYTSTGTIFYQRSTVIITDLVYYYAVYVWLKLLSSKNGSNLTKWARPLMSEDLRSSQFVYSFLFIFNVGHLIVDHIHFQYNGLLNGLLLLSIARMVNGQIYLSAFWFAILLNFKHIYLYMAPAYFIFLLFEHCIEVGQTFKSTKINWITLINLSLIVLVVFGISFVPFIVNGQIGKLLERLFPFKRGLCHAYWAPNWWAIYNVIDLILSKIYIGKTSNMTSGLVQEFDHLLLPSISPKISLSLVLLSLLVSTVQYFRKKSRSEPISFIELTIASTASFFIFGYHVHEKAILLIIPVMIPLIFAKQIYARNFLIVSTIGYFSLFPVAISRSRNNGYSFGPILFSTSFERYPFLPLMTISFYCSIGLLYVFIRFIIQMSTINESIKS